MALSAGQIAGSRMLKAGNSPTCCRVALGAVFAEEGQVAVFCGVASIAVQGLTRSAFVELSGDSNPQPRLHGFESGGAGRVRVRGPSQGSSPYSGKFHMIHRDGADVQPLMLDVADGTLADIRVEGGRLAAEQLFRVRMAGRAFSVCYADVRFVARFASITQIGVTR